VENREEKNPRVGERWYIKRITEIARLWIRQDGEYVHVEAFRGWEPPLTFRDEFEVKYVDDTRIGYFGITESCACTYWERLPRLERPLNRARKLQNDEFWEFLYETPTNWT